MINLDKIQANRKTAEALVRIIEREGSLMGAGRTLGTSYQTIRRWIKGMCPISPAYQGIIRQVDREQEPF